MAKWGSFDYKKLEKMAKNFDKAVQEQLGEQLLIAVLLEAANIGLRKTKKRTPVGVYCNRVEFTANLPAKDVRFTTKTGKNVAFTAKARTRKVAFEVSKVQKGGTLRRGWFVSDVKREGDTFYVELANNVEYASFVEFGHRIKNAAKWVEGRYMLTISMKEVEAILPKISDKHTKRLLNELLKGV